MDDEQGDSAVGGGELGLARQRGVVGEVALGESAAAVGTVGLEAHDQGDFALHIDAGVVIVFVAGGVLGGDAVADEDDGAGERAFGGEGGGAEVVGEFADDWGGGGGGGG